MSGMATSVTGSRMMAPVMGHMKDGYTHGCGCCCDMLGASLMWAMYSGH